MKEREWKRKEKEKNIAGQLKKKTGDDKIHEQAVYPGPRDRLRYNDKCWDTNDEYKLVSNRQGMKMMMIHPQRRNKQTLGGGGELHKRVIWIFGMKSKEMFSIFF